MAPVKSSKNQVALTWDFFFQLDEVTQLNPLEWQNCPRWLDSLKNSSISYDELITAPVLVAPIREVPADDDGNLPAPVIEEKQDVQCL